MDENLFFGCISDHNIPYLQNWTGPALSGMTLVKEYADLSQCHKKIILIPSVVANFHFDLTKQLIEQQNYLVMLDTLEINSNPHRDLLRDLPTIEQFPRILGGKKDNVDSFNLHTFYFLTLTDPNYLKATLYTTEQSYANNSKPYKFLYLNGGDRPHRNQLWHTLDSVDLLDQALKSYLGYRVSTRLNACDIPLTVLDQKYESMYVDLDKIPLFSVDERNYKTFKQDYWQGQWVDSHVIPAQYIDTYFSLVTETTYMPGEYFITEKTYKPLLAGHPFIVLSGPGFYSYLRELGFKTFHPFINESFDQEMDLSQRIKMITAEVERLCASDLDQFQQQVKDICLHNQQHYVANRLPLFTQIHHQLNNFFTQVKNNAEIYFNKELYA
jgi:hypothetical protein